MQVSLLFAASITLGWNPNPELDVHQYRLYVGREPMPPAAPLQIIPTNETTQIVDIDFGILYYFRVTAINDMGYESDFSNQVTYTLAAPTPTPTPEPTPTPRRPRKHKGWYK